jgi:hypothetical protein
MAMRIAFGQILGDALRSRPLSGARQAFLVQLASAPVGYLLSRGRVRRENLRRPV